MNAAPLAFRPTILLATLSEYCAEKHESRPRPPPFPLGAGAVAALVGYGRRPKKGRCSLESPSSSACTGCSGCSLSSSYSLPWWLFYFRMTLSAWALPRGVLAVRRHALGRTWERSLVTSPTTPQATLPGSCLPPLHASAHFLLCPRRSFQRVRYEGAE